MQLRQLGASGPIVSCLALGHSMGASDFSAAGRTQFDALIGRALELGVTFFDSSDAYWNGLHEEWLGTALGSARKNVVVTSKFGNLTLPDGSKATDARPEYAIACCEASLKRLGTDCIDVYYLHRVDPKVPIEDTFGAMSRLVQQGKVRHLGICEAGVATLERAHRVHPLAALQTEYSLWARDAEADVIPACRRLGIGFVGYSPLGRGMLTGAIASLEDLGENDRRRDHPRFQDGNIQSNAGLIKPLTDMAKAKGCTPSQLALAWLLAQGGDVVPIPGTKRRSHLKDNLAAVSVQLSGEEAALLSRGIDDSQVAGTRYPKGQMAMLGV